MIKKTKAQRLMDVIEKLAYYHSMLERCSILLWVENYTYYKSESIMMKEQHEFAECGFRAKKLIEAMLEAFIKK